MRTQYIIELYNMQKFIAHLYTLLVFGTPLIFFTKTSESFELPKITFVYGITVLIVALWIARMVIEKKLIFQQTLLDLPLIFFLLTLLLSTIFSIDILTSLQGYYSRFYGGLTSQIAMALLYWVAVSNLHKKDMKKLLDAIIASGVIAAIWTIMERFGYSPSCLFINGSFEVSCWTQQVQERPFASFGQPNWLAAYLVMILPIAWKRIKEIKTFFYFGISILIFLAILFTKSRGGLVGLGVAFIIYWGYQLLSKRSKSSKLFMILTSCYLLLSIIFNPLKIHTQENPDPTVTASTDIRLLLWQGALDIWRANPLTGTGPETFAYSYYEHRPAIHNLTSEWNFVYNKAHNEYFNHLANIGILGLTAFIILIVFSIRQIDKKNISLLAGYVSLLVSNFFSFSVVATGLLFFLYPVFAIAPSRRHTFNKLKFSLNAQRVALLTVFLTTCYLLLTVFRFAYADYLYARDNYQQAKQAVDIAPWQPQYWEKLGGIYTKIDSDYLAHEAFEKALALAPRNVKLHKNIVQQYLLLGNIDSQHYASALQILKQLESMAPTDPMIPYFQALVHINIGESQMAKQFLNKALMMKPQYRDAQEAFLIIEARN